MSVREMEICVGEGVSMYVRGMCDMHMEGVHTRVLVSLLSTSGGFWMMCLYCQSPLH
jgi:hypothetical protein